MVNGSNGSCGRVMNDSKTLIPTQINCLFKVDSGYHKVEPVLSSDGARFNDYFVIMHEMIMHVKINYD